MSARDSAVRIDELQRCAQCTKALSTAKRCGACSAVLYCDVECQRAHWTRAHKDSCARLPAALRGAHWAISYNGDTLAVLRGLQHVPTPDGSLLCTLDAGRFDVLVDPKYSDTSDTGVRFTGVTHCLFAQFVLYATTPPDKLPAKMVFGLDEASLLSAHALLRDARVLDDANASDAMVHLALHGDEDAELCASLQDAHTGAFSAYLFGPSTDGTYMGLAEAGPIRLTADAWREQLHSEALTHLSALLMVDHKSKASLAVSAAIDLPLARLTLVSVL